MVSATSSRTSALEAETRRAGFRSIERVSLTTDGVRTTAEVTGILHRYPQTVRVSLSTARRLAAAGATLRVRTLTTGRRS